MPTRNLSTIQQIVENFRKLNSLSLIISTIDKSRNGEDGSGYEIVHARLVKMMNKTVKFFSVGKGMDSAMIEETADLLIAEYFWLSLEDFELFFNKLKLGHYGKSFDRMDGNVILVALLEYTEERTRTAIKVSEVEHNQVKTIYETENFVIKIDGNFWIRENGLVYEEVSKRELATQFTYANAIKIQKWLNSHKEVGNNTEIKLERANKADIKLLDYLKDNKPQLLTEKTKYHQATKDYYEKKKLIDANESLSDFEKENAKRKLAKIEPLTQEEYITRKNTIIYKP